MNRNDAAKLRRGRIAVSIASLISVCTWLWSLESAWSFFADATDYVAETGSVNAANDLAYSQVMLLATSAGSLATVASAMWLAYTRSVHATAAFTWTACFGVAFAFGDHAHPIHLLPTGGPLLLAFTVTGCLLAVLLVVAQLLRRSTRHAAKS